MNGKLDLGSNGLVSGGNEDTAAIAVSERALMARINRRLATNNERLGKCNPRSRWHHTTGDHFLYNHCEQSLTPWQDIEQLGRELGALKFWESLQD